MAVVLIAGELTALAIALTIAVNAALILVMAALCWAIYTQFIPALIDLATGGSSIQGMTPLANTLEIPRVQSDGQPSNILEIPQRAFPARAIPSHQGASRQLPDRNPPSNRVIPQWPPGWQGGGGGNGGGNGGGGGGGNGGGGGGGNPDPRLLDTLEQAVTFFCQTNLEPEVGVPLQALASTIAGALGPAAPIVVMATTIINLINALAPNLPGLSSILPQLLQALTSIDLAGLVGAVDSVRTQLETCCTELQSALAKQYALDDPKLEVYQQMAADGVITPENLQLFSDPIKLRIDPSRIHPEVRKALKYLGLVKPTEVNRAWAWIEAAIDSWIAYLKPYAQSLLNSLAPQLYDTVTSITDNAGSIISLFSKLETTLPKDAFDAVIKIADLGESTTPDQIEAAAFKLFGAAFLAGQALHLLAGLAGFIGYPMSSVWANNASLLVDLLAFDEIRAALHGAFFKAAIEAKASQKYLSVHRPYPLSLGEATVAFGRRELTEIEFDSLAALAGKNASSLPHIKNLAYHPIPPFILGSAFVDQPIDEHALTGALRRGQIDPHDFKLLATALENRSVQTLRNAVITESTTAAKAGLLSLADLDDNVTVAFKTLDVNSLLHIAATIGQMSQVGTTTIRAALDELRTGTLNAAQARALMAAAGVQDWRINVEVTLGAAMAAAASERKAEAQELAFARKSFTQTLTALGVQFLAGTINAAAFTAEAQAELLAFLGVASEIGESPASIASELKQGEAQIASRLALLEAQAAGRAVAVFGVVLPRNEAIALREKVSALEEATIRTDITAEQAYQSLLDLTIPPVNARALVDRWKLQDSPKGSSPLGADKPRY